MVTNYEDITNEDIDIDFQSFKIEDSDLLDLEYETNHEPYDSLLDTDVPDLEFNQADIETLDNMFHEDPFIDNNRDELQTKYFRNEEILFNSVPNSMIGETEKDETGTFNIFKPSETVTDAIFKNNDEKSPNFETVNVNTPNFDFETVKTPSEDVSTPNPDFDDKENTKEPKNESGIRRDKVLPATNNFLIENLQKVIDEQKIIINSLKIEKENMYTKMLADQEVRITLLQRKEQSKYADLENSLRSEIAVLHEQLKKSNEHKELDVLRIKKDILSEKEVVLTKYISEFAEEREKIIREKDNEILKLKEQFEIDKERRQKEYEFEAQKQRNDYMNTIEALEKELSSVKIECDEKIKRLNTDNETKIAKIKEDHNSELNVNLDERLKAANREHELQINNLKVQIASQGTLISKLKSDHEAELNNLKADHLLNVQFLERRVQESELYAIKSRSAASVQTSIDKIDIGIQNSVRTVDRSTECNFAEDKLQSENAELKKQVESLHSEQKHKVKELLKQVESMSSSMEKQQSEAQQEIRRVAFKIKEQCTKVYEQTLEKLDKGLKALTKERDELKRELQTRSTQSDQIRVYETQISSLSARINQLQETWKQEKETYKQLIEETKITMEEDKKLSVQKLKVQYLETLKRLKVEVEKNKQETILGIKKEIEARYQKRFNELHNNHELKLLKLRDEYQSKLQKMIDMSH